MSSLTGHSYLCLSTYADCASIVGFATGADEFEVLSECDDLRCWRIGGQRAGAYARTYLGI